MVNFKNRISNEVLDIKNSIKSFNEFLKNNVATVVITLFFTLMTYGIKLFQYSISIDTEMLINRYDWQLDTWASFGRFGLVFIKKILGLNPFNPYAACFLMVSAMIIFCLIWSYVINEFSFNENKSNIRNAIFPSVFITSPLFAEQFNFILQSFEVAFAIILCSIAILCVSNWVLDSKKVINLIIGIACMILGFGTYQSIVFLYISAALACYILIYISNKKSKVKLEKSFFILAAVKYLGSFIVAYVSFAIVNKIVVNIYGKSGYVDNMVKWGQQSVQECIENIVKYMKIAFLGDGIFYSKVFALVFIGLFVYAIINLFSKSRDKILLLLAMMAFILSPFILSIYMGNGQIPRMQFSYQFVIAMGIYIFSLVFDKKLLAIILSLFGFYVAFNQSYIVNRLFYTEQIKYEDDVRLADKISEKIELLNLGEIPEYPVVLVGGHRSKVPNQLRGEFLGLSWFEYGGDSHRALGFMRTIGYPYITATDEETQRAKEIAQTMDVWPNNGSVIFKDGLIIVRLS